MEVAVAGVPKRDDIDSQMAGDSPSASKVLVQMRNGNAAVLDDLERAPLGTELGESGTRGMTNRPQPLPGRLVQGGFDASGTIRPDALRLPGCCPSVSIRFALEFHEQHALGSHESVAHVGRRETQERPVEEFDRRRIECQQALDDLTQPIEIVEHEQQRRRGSRPLLELQLDLGDDAEGSLGADDEVHGVARMQELLERVTRRVFRRAGKPLLDRRGIPENRWPDVPIESSQCSERSGRSHLAGSSSDPAELTIAGGQLDAAHPATHTPVAHAP